MRSFMDLDGLTVHEEIEEWPKQEIIAHLGSTLVYTSLKLGLVKTFFEPQNVNGRQPSRSLWDHSPYSGAYLGKNRERRYLHTLLKVVSFSHTANRSAIQIGISGISSSAHHRPTSPPHFS